MAKKYDKQDLSGRSFRGESLVGARFRGAILRGCDFRECDLRSADFRGADCSGALFDGVRIGRSSLWAAGVEIAGFVLCWVLSVTSILSFGLTLEEILGATNNALVVGVAAALFAGLPVLVAVLSYRVVRWTFFVVTAGTFVIAALVGGVTGVFAVVVIAVAWALQAPLYQATASALAAALTCQIVASSVWPGRLALALAFAISQNRLDGVAAPAALLLMVHCYLAWRISPRFLLVTEARLVAMGIGSTRFDNAVLKGASFTGTNMRAARLANADLSRVRWRDATNLTEARQSNSVLGQPAVRDLLTLRDGKGIDLTRADMHSLDLSGTDLRGANLKETNCTNSLFHDAELTGACIEAWNIDATTDLIGVRCDYVYLSDQPEDRQRRPADPARNFAPGEFAKLYTEAIRQMEILLKNQLPLAAIGETVQELQKQHPGVRVSKIEDRGEDILLGLDLPRGTDEAAVDRNLVRLWQEKCHLLEAHNRDLKEIALAAKAGVQQIGGVMEYKGIQGNVTIQNSQVGSVTGDVSRITQTLTQSGGDAATLGAAIDKLAAAIAESQMITAPEKHEAAQQVATVAKAAEAPKDPGWQAAAGKALDRLTSLLGKAPDLVKLVEVTQKAWEAVAKGMGL